MDQGSNVLLRSMNYALAYPIAFRSDGVWRALEMRAAQQLLKLNGFVVLRLNNGQRVTVKRKPHAYRQD